MPAEVTREYFWVQNEQEYQTCFNAAAAGSIAIIDPGNPVRRRAWERVLSWYGAVPASSSMNSSRLAITNTPDHGDAVAALHSDVAAPAQLYAVALQRPFIDLSAHARDLPDALAKLQHSSVLLVAPRHMLTLGCLQSVADRFTVPWGILTADDVPALTFLVAKLLIGAPDQEGWICIDAVDEMTREIVPGGAEITHPLEAGYLADIVKRRDWHTIVVRAHGEGGHLNLEHIVLCGVMGGEERDDQGRMIDGCMQTERFRRCKRVHQPDKTILSFGELRAAELYLFSCTGFMLNGELYPSSISSVLSAVEGFPSVIVATDSLTPGNARLPAAMLHLLKSGVAPGPAVALLNDLHARRFGCRPYFLCGDPSGAAPSWVIPSAAGEIEIGSDTRVAAIRFDSAAIPEILALRVPGAPEIWLEAGGSTALVSFGGAGAGGCGKLVDKTPALCSIEGIMRDVASRLRHAAWMERAIERQCQRHLPDRPDLRERLRSLTQVRLRLEYCVQATFDRICLIRHAGVWSDHLEEWVQLTSLQVAVWDQQFADLFAKYLFELVPVTNVITDAYLPVGKERDAACPYCASLMQTVTLEPPSRDWQDYVHTACPLCGTCETRGRNSTRLDVRPPASLVPGTTADVEFTIFPGASPLLDVVPSGLLVMELMDKGQDRRVVQCSVKVDGPSHMERIPVPEDLTSELHTMHFALIRGLDVTFVRRRSLCVRDKRATHSA